MKILDYLKEIGINLDTFIDYDKNSKENIDINDITCYSRKEFWVKCQNYSYHGSYKVSALFFMNNKSRRTFGCPYCMNKKLHYKDTFSYRYPLQSKWWNYDKNDKAPNEVRYNQPYLANFICPKCKQYSFSRNVKFISEYPFKSHICRFDKINLMADKNIYDKNEMDLKAIQRLQKAKELVYNKYGDEWKLIYFTGTNRPCILKHSCGNKKKISRFNNILNHNLKCECEK